MRRTNAKIVGGVLVLAVILVAVAYAAITSTQLNINGTGNATTNQSNFKVEFIGTPTTGGKGTTTATIDSNIKTNGNVEVNGLTAKGDEATATYTVKNQSADLSADLSAEATSSNEEYFEVLCTLEKTTLKAQEETTLKVTVRLLKTPIDETKENLKTDIGVTVTAEPKQPGEENNGGSQTVSNGKTTGGTYLPKGFRQVSGTTSENGLTIQDSTGNQYVWVEVPKTAEVYPTAGLEITEFTEAEYTAIETDLHTYTNDYRVSGGWEKDKYSSDAITGLTSEQYTQLKQKMLKSVYQNGGFYIGKYETGTETARTSGSSSTAPEETPVIKQNVYPYNYVTCSQAQTLATTKMESGDRTTSLLFGVQWDLTLKYLEKKGTSQADLKTDSTSWGNYRSNAWNITNANLKYAPDGSGWRTATEKSKTDSEKILLSTGADDSFSKMGIYDLAGNVWEWTLEYTGSSANPCALRGGSYFESGSYGTPGYRNSTGATQLNAGLGFRLALY